jgi:hypothetical protein
LCTASKPSRNSNSDSSRWRRQSNNISRIQRVTATDEEDNEHEITGISENVAATSFAINPGQSVQIQFEGTGQVELTLAKSLIANITAVQAGTETIQYTSVNETNTATTISFEVPQDQTLVRIMS